MPNALDARQAELTVTWLQGRVLSLAWHPTGKTLVSGHSDGCLRAWDAATTREIYRVTAGAQSRRPPPCSAS